MKLPFTPSSWCRTFALKSHPRRSEAAIKMTSAVHCQIVRRPICRLSSIEGAETDGGVALITFDLRFLISAGAADIWEFAQTARLGDIANIATNPSAALSVSACGAA